MRQAKLSGMWRAGLAAAAMSWTAACVQGQVFTSLISSNLFEPYGVAVDDGNNYYLTDSANNRIVKYISDTGLLLTNYAGSVLAGASDGSGVVASFSAPLGIAFLPGTNVFVVADSHNNQLRYVRSDATVGTAFDRVGGGPDQPGFNDGPVPRAQARFNDPRGLAVDGAGNIYVADFQNHAVRRVGTDGMVYTVATNFARPEAMVLVDGRLLVADAVNHGIKLIANPLAETVQEAALIAGADDRREFEYVDASTPLAARFYAPRGLVALTESQVLVADAGNRVLRELAWDVGGKQVVNVATYQPSASGLFQEPVGMALTRERNLLVVDRRQNTLFVLKNSSSLPQITPPQIGYIVVTNTAEGIKSYLVPFKEAIFFNDMTLGILPEAGVSTHYLTDNSNRVENVRDPNADDPTPPVYIDGQYPLPDNLITSFRSNIIIKAYSRQQGRQPSPVTTAVASFQVANPVILGSAWAVRVECATVDAKVYYSLARTNGTEAIGDPPEWQLYVPGTTINLELTPERPKETVTFRTKAAKGHYAPSREVTRIFNAPSSDEVVQLGLTKDYLAAPGATIIVPVEASLPQDAQLQSLQYRLLVRSQTGGQIADLGLGTVVGSARDFVSAPSASGLPRTERRFDGAAWQLGVAYLGSNSMPLLQVSAPVTLIEFQVPASASFGARYELAFTNLSGTMDGLQHSIPIMAMAPRTITVTNLAYRVGDVAAGLGYNTGDFGDGVLANADVNLIFYASLGLGTPFPFTDVYNAMDAFPEDTAVSPGGDGQIRYLDWQRVLRRSLGFGTEAWVRYRTNGGALVAVDLNAPKAAPVRPQSPSTELAASTGAGWRPRPVRLWAGEVAYAHPGGLVLVPVYLRLDPGWNWVGGQFWPVVSRDQAGLISETPVEFVANGGVPAPAVNSLPGVGVYGRAFSWDEGQIQPPLQASNLLGYLRFSVPSSAVQGERYWVRFANADGATADARQIDAETVPGSVWVGEALQPAAEVPDQWRTNFFGTLASEKSPETADPDADGLANLTEYRLGTDPLRGDWRVEIADAAGIRVVRWYGEAGKSYRLMESGDLKSWVRLGGDLPGRGGWLEWRDATDASQQRFYRVELVP